MKKQQLESAAEFIVAEAKRLGASDCEVTIGAGQSVDVGVRLGKVEELQGAQTQGLDFKAFVGTRHATVSTADLRRRSLTRLVRETIATAKLAQEDPSAGLAERGQFASSFPDLDLFDGAASALPVEKKIEMAMAAEAAAMGADKRISNSEGAGFSERTGVTVKANSRGFVGAYEGSSCSISATVIATDEGGMQVGGWWSSSRKLSGLESAEEVGKVAAEHALRQLGARRVKSQSCPVVFDPQMAARLVSQLVGAAAGAHIYRKSSFLAGKRGELIASPLVTIVDDPLMKGGLASRPFDGEGLPSAKRVIVGDGKLECYLLGVYSARKLGEAPNGGSTSNLYLKAGNVSAEDIIASVDNGLYLTSVSGPGFNQTTGDYSVGASGMWIEKGKIAFPVQGITIAGNVVDMFNGIEAIGSDLVFRSGVNAPTVKIARMMIAGE